MPLLDHFQAPLYPARSWESFHSRWANSIADALNRDLPPRYVAEVQIHLGNQVEADVAEFENVSASALPTNGGLAVQTWAPPVPALTMPAVYPDDLEVRVLDQREDARLAGVVELVGPRNKDRAESRRGFAAKCVAYLQRGIGVIVLDIVTSRQANLHRELVTLLGQERFPMGDNPTLYAVAYRPARRGENNEIDIWPVVLSIGQALPTLPLALKGSAAVPVDLEATYMDARERSRL
jgi:hypothetical protein